MTRLVIDTNVLVSALIFKDSRHLPLREAWQQKRITPLVSIATYRELKHVLGYPMFKLEDHQITEAIALIGPYTEWVTIDPERRHAPQMQRPRRPKISASRAVRRRRSATELRPGAVEDEAGIAIPRAQTRGLGGDSFLLKALFELGLEVVIGVSR